MDFEIEKEDGKFSIETECEEYTLNYSVIENCEKNLPHYGIKISCSDGKEDSLENIFFTADEAIKRCEWLAENKVFVKGFRDVMEEIML